MDTVRLGRSGLKVSRISLGAMGFGDPSWRSWVLDEAAAIPIIKRALDAGISLIDTCDFYSRGESEALIGRLMSTIIPRNEVVIATKLGFPMGSGPNNRGYGRKHIIEAAEGSLRRLKTDRIDLLQTHIWDPETNIEEMICALDHLVKSGKVLYVGATDMPAWQFAKAIYTARGSGLAAFATMQNHYNLVWRGDERELYPLCQAEGIGVMPYSPMARGFLCGTSRRQNKTTERARTDEYAEKWYGRREDAAVAARVEAIAGEYNATPAQIALAWVLRHPAVHSPIIGATAVDHIDQAVRALDLRLDDAHVNELESMYSPRLSYSHV